MALSFFCLHELHELRELHDLHVVYCRCMLRVVSAEIRTKYCVRRVLFSFILYDDTFVYKVGIVCHAVL